jgi:hypothetical protein
MAFEVELLLYFHDYPPTEEDIENALDCDVLSMTEEEV